MRKTALAGSDKLIIVKALVGPPGANRLAVAGAHVILRRSYGAERRRALQDGAPMAYSQVFDSPQSDFVGHWCG